MEILTILQNKNIQFDKGLSEEELKEIEGIYDIVFPKSLRDFLMSALPVSRGFYNWRDKSNENVSLTKDIMSSDIKWIKEHAKDAYCFDFTHANPKSPEEIREYVLSIIDDAPKIIPIYGHRFIPMGVSDNPPVISVCGCDVIYYGANLEDYFQIEFGNKKQSEIDFSNIQKIPFWTDIM